MRPIEVLRKSKSFRVWVAIAFAVSGVLLLSGTSVAEPALYPVINPSGADQAKPPVALVGSPRGPTDQRIFQVPDTPGQYFAAGASFAAVFHLPVNPPLVTFYTEEGEVRVSPRSPHPERVTAAISDNRITYTDFFAPGVDLSYVVALTGLKEEITVPSPAELEPLSSLTAEVTLPDGRPQASLAGTPVDFLAIAHGNATLSDALGRPVAFLPPAVALPADLEARGEIALDYLIQPYGDRLLASLVIDDDLLAKSSKAKNRMGEVSSERLDDLWEKAQREYLDGRPGPMKSPLAEIEGVNKLDDRIGSFADKDQWTIELADPDAKVKNVDAIAHGPGGKSISVEVKSHQAGVSPETVRSRAKDAYRQLEASGGDEKVVLVWLEDPAQKADVKAWYLEEIDVGGGQTVSLSEGQIRFMDGDWNLPPSS